MKFPPHSRTRQHVMAMVATLCMSASYAHAEHAHTHGLLQLDVAIDPQSVTLQFESPLENFLGFEHAPRTDAERKKVADLTASLKAADGLFYIDPAAGCRVSKVELDSAVPGLGRDAEKKLPPRDHDIANGARTHSHSDEHGDIDATIVFSCNKAEAARFIAFKLFEKYKNLHTVNVQVASSQGQFKRTMRADSPKLDLGR
jgi:methionine-rich copper-binding protein CopC